MSSEGESLFGIWAPAGSPWSPWAKPVLFASAGRLERTVTLPATEVGWAREGSVVVVDLPGIMSVAAGVALAAKGHRPVPLYNGVHGAGAGVDQEPLLAALAAGAETLQGMRLPASAPPAFLLDARRFPPGRAAAPGKLDNRWMVFPQDLPSANLLLSHGLRHAVVLREDPLMDDLAHVLRRWQEAGIGIEEKLAKESDPPRPIEVRKPSRYRTAWYRALAILGLGRSDAGGFGMRVPIPAPPSPGGGGGFRGGGFFG
ncbi:MAG TPA: hypothetical protein VFY93_15830 [Planctomycetota bacterium]|nr:hypothetical protein [Planctomycetota bacterium]